MVFVLHTCLCSAILHCCNSVVPSNETFAQYFCKKIAEGKPYNVTRSHLAKKLLRVVYILETTGSRFDLSKLR